MEQTKRHQGRPKGQKPSGGRRVGFRLPKTDTSPGVSLVIRVPAELRTELSAQYGREIPSMIREYLTGLLKGEYETVTGPDLHDPAVPSTNISVRMKARLKNALILQYGGELSPIIRRYLGTLPR